MGWALLLLGSLLTGLESAFAVRAVGTRVVPRWPWGVSSTALASACDLVVQAAGRPAWKGEASPKGRSREQQELVDK